MTVLSDEDIERELKYTRQCEQVEWRHCDGLKIDPYDESNLQPASYDLTLGREFAIETVDLPGMTVQSIEDGPADRFVDDLDEIRIEPGEFVLGHTKEHIRLPDDITAEVKGRSSLGRLGLIPHTAGWVDPGFTGTVTLEFVNHSNQPVRLHAGDRIAQIVFSYTESPANTAYGAKDDQKYQGQTGVTESRIGQDEA